MRFFCFAARLTALLLIVPGSALAMNPVPEVDPSSAGGALLLLSGCGLVLRASRKKTGRL
jgi:hypothetical protein